MKWVEAEGTNYVYFAREEGVAVPTVLGLSIDVAPPYMMFQLARSTDIRLVLAKSFTSPDRGIPYYLHWDNGQGLDDLDRRVEQDAYTDEDCARSAKTAYQHTKCGSCGLAWPTLVIPPGDPYIGARGLYEKKVREHAIVKACPNCGAAFRQLVVKIF